MDAAEIQKRVTLEMLPAPMVAALQNRLAKSRRRYWLRGWLRSPVFWVLSIFGGFFGCILFGVIQEHLGVQPDFRWIDSGFARAMAFYLFVITLAVMGVLIFLINHKIHNPRGLELIHLLLRELQPELHPKYKVRLEIKRRPDFILFGGPWLKAVLVLRDGTAVHLRAQSDVQISKTHRKTKYKAVEGFSIAFYPARSRVYQPRAMMPTSAMMTRGMRLRKIDIKAGRSVFVWKGFRLRHVTHRKRGVLVNEIEKLVSGTALLHLLLSSWYLLQSTQAESAGEALPNRSPEAMST